MRTYDVHALRRLCCKMAQEICCINNWPGGICEFRSLDLSISCLNPLEGEGQFRSFCAYRRVGSRTRRCAAFFYTCCWSVCNCNYISTDRRLGRHPIRWHPITVSVKMASILVYRMHMQNVSVGTCSMYDPKCRDEIWPSDQNGPRPRE